MSYILDALKKSEKKRPPGLVPDLFTVQGPQPLASSRRPLLALAGAVVLGVVMLIGGWVWRDTRKVTEPVPSRRSAAVTQPPAGVSQKAGDAPIPDASPLVAIPAPLASRARAGSAAAPVMATRRPESGTSGPDVKGAIPARAPSPAPAARAASAVASSGSRVVSEKAEGAPAAGGTAALPAVPETPAAATSQSPVAPISQPVAAPSSSPAPANVVAAPQAPVAPVPVVTVPAAPAATSPSAAAPAPSLIPLSVPAGEVAPTAPALQEAATADAPPADGRIMNIEELPQSVRVALGKFAVSGHVWSEEPGLRLLTVENRIVREGQEAVAGVRLEAITQDGAVFTLQGWRFRVSGF